MPASGKITAYTAITVDEYNNPHIGYFTGGELKHAEYDGSNWQFGTERGQSP